MAKITVILQMPMLKAMSVLSNAAISEFVIRNNVTTAISPKARIDSWNAVDQAFPFRFSQPENSDIIVYRQALNFSFC